MRKWPAILLALLVLAPAAFAQDEWYIGKPIADFRFTGLQIVNESELAPIVRPYVGQEFTLDVFFEIQDKLYALDLKTGKETCHFTAKGPIISYPAFYKDLVIFSGGQGDGNVYAVRQGSCKLFFSHKTGYKIESDPVIDGDRFYVTSGDRKLYSFKINKTK